MIDTVQQRSPWAGSSAAITALVELAALHTIYFARELLRPITAAYFLKLVLTPPVRWLRRRRVPESLGAAVVLGATLAAAGLSAYSRPLVPDSPWILDRNLIHTVPPNQAWGEDSWTSSSSITAIG